MVKYRLEIFFHREVQHLIGNEGYFTSLILLQPKYFF